MLHCVDFCPFSFLTKTTECIQLWRMGLPVDVPFSLCYNWKRAKVYTITANFPTCKHLDILAWTFHQSFAAHTNPFPAVCSVFPQGLRGPLGPKGRPGPPGPKARMLIKWLVCTWWARGWTFSVLITGVPWPSRRNGREREQGWPQLYKSGLYWQPC